MAWLRGDELFCKFSLRLFIGQPFHKNNPSTSITIQSSKFKSQVAPTLEQHLLTSSVASSSPIRQ